MFHVLYHCMIPITFIQNTLSLDKCVPHEEHVMADMLHHGLQIICWDTRNIRLGSRWYFFWDAYLWQWNVAARWRSVGMYMYVPYSMYTSWEKTLNRCRISATNTGTPFPTHKTPPLPQHSVTFHVKRQRSQPMSWSADWRPRESWCYSSWIRLKKTVDVNSLVNCQVVSCFTHFSTLPDCFDMFNPQFGQSGCTPHDDAGNNQDSAGISSPQIEGAGGALRLLVLEVEHDFSKPLQSHGLVIVEASCKLSVNKTTRIYTSTRSGCQKKTSRSSFKDFCTSNITQRQPETPPVSFFLVARHWCQHHPGSCQQPYGHLPPGEGDQNYTAHMGLIENQYMDPY